MALGFRGVQARSGLLVPLYGPDGEPCQKQLKADKPFVGRDGKTWKYMTPSGSKIRIDFPPRVRRRIRRSSEPLLITEGVKKADAAASKGLACLGLTGVWCWRDKSGPLPEWRSVPLRGRDVYVAYDSDVMTNPKVHKALEALTAYLTKRGAGVRWVYLPPGADGGKVGLDDYLGTGHSTEELFRLAVRPGEDQTGGEYGRLGRILTRSDLARLPKPEPLIEGMISLRSYVLMIGRGDTNKTFVALGFACSVATGKPWLGRSVLVGAAPVIYVVGEGAYGIDDRIAAWEEANGTPVPPDMLTVLMKPASLSEEGFWEELTALAKRRGARLVVFDTLSSLAPDLDETADAPIITRRLSDLAAEIDGTTLMVHHTGWGAQDRARGGSQFEHNADEALVLQRIEDDDSHVVSLTRKKVKDGPSGQRIWLRRVELDPSCVMEETAEPQRVSAKKTTAEPSVENILSVLKEKGRLGFEDLRKQAIGHATKVGPLIKIGIEREYINTEKAGRVIYHSLTPAGLKHLEESKRVMVI
ncbi:AAA family ATPase [Plantactinospora veratri]